jgi:hypothetical protein
MRPSVLRRLQSVTGHLQERSPVGVSQAAAADSAASTTANSDELVLTLASGRVSSSGGKLGALRRSSVDLSGEEMRGRMDADGYLFLPGLIPRSAIDVAYKQAREELESIGTWPGGKFSAAWRSQPDVMRVAEAPELAFACTRLFGGVEAASYPFKWLRTGQPGGGTGFHVDNVYMNRGSTKLTTAWIPLHDTPYELGGLCVLEGSHRLPGFERFRNTYGQHDWSSWVSPVTWPPLLRGNPAVTLMCMRRTTRSSDTLGYTPMIRITC